MVNEVKKASVVIICYKTEKYLAECVDSVLAQDYPELEIILVDDGSPDNCPRLCDDYEKMDDRISAIHQENQGSGIARNTGLLAATGDFVFFMDSDDRLDGTDSISALMQASEEADIVQGLYSRFGEGIDSAIRGHSLSGLDQRSGKFRFMGFYYDGHLSYNWGKLYRRSFLLDNKLFLPSYPFTQDKAHNFMCYAKKARYRFVDSPVLCYRIYDTSVSFRYKPDFTEVWTAIGQDFLDWCRHEDIGDDCLDLVAWHVFFGAYFLAKDELIAGHDRSERIKKLALYCGTDVCRKALVSLSHGKYLGDVYGISWRIFMWFGSWVLCHGGYGIFDMLTGIFQGIRMDRIMLKLRLFSDKKRHTDER